MSSQQNIRYIALTIGPVVPTLTSARKTRELWAASYIFSWIMKQVARELKKDPKRQFVLPYQEEDLGVYQDHVERTSKGGSDLHGAGL
ncbi:MAG: type III-B CRISPR-associated protein Cas10/Cmr2, partial [Bacteroidota bacterium]